MTTIPSPPEAEDDSRLAAPFIAELIICRRTIQSYPESHPSITASLEKVISRLELLLGEAKAITFGISQAGLMVHKEYLLNSSLKFDDYSALLASFGIISITFKKGLTTDELRKFNGIISRPRDSVWQNGGMISALSEAGVGSIQVQVIDPSVFVLTEGLDQGDTQDAADPWEVFVKKLLRGFFTMSRQTRMDLLLALPSDLAHELEAALTGVPEGATHQTFSLLGEFLVGLAHRHHRQSLDEPTFNKIYSFIGGLSPEIRHQLILNICRSTKTTFAFNERLLARLPGRELRRIMHALSQQREVPEGLLHLVQKLSSLGDSPLQVGAAVSGKGAEEKVRLLVESGELEKYVPQHYRQTLVTILTRDSLPSTAADELSRLKTTLAADAIEMKIADILALIMQTVPVEEQGEGIRRNLTDMMFYFLERRDFDALSRICAVIIKNNRQLKGEVIMGPALVRRVLDAAYFLGKESYPGVRLIVSAVGRPFVVPLIERLGDEEDRSLRRFWFDCLSSLGSMVRDAALERLGDERWYVLRNLLVLLRDFSDEDVKQQVRLLAKNPHDKVRSEALRNLLHYGDAAATRILLDDMASSDPDRLLKGIQNAENSHHPAVGARLLAIASADGFKEYSLEPRVAAVKALAANGNGEALRAFVDILKSSSMFNAGKLTTLKTEILRVLPRYPSDQTDPVLQELSSAGGKVLAPLAAEILRRSRRGSP